MPNLLIPRMTLCFDSKTRIQCFREKFSINESEIDPQEGASRLIKVF
jgi:hypothetical protein